MAAGVGSRFGGLKQLAPIGPSGETLIEYSIYDALQAGFRNIVFVIRPDILPDFESTIFQKINHLANITYVFQEPIASNPLREKPWGTAHAVLAAKNTISGSFVVINADDYYGPSSYNALASFLNTNHTDQALVGFKLKNTLSSNGSVSRGICSTSKDGLLLSLQEHRFIAKDDNNRLVDWDPSGKPTILTGNEIASLNMWAFQHTFFNILESYFTDFLKQNATSSTAECFLPSAVDFAIQNNLINVHVLPTTESWFGLTYKDDLDVLRFAIKNRIESHLYPDDLWNVGSTSKK